jgi:glycerol-3-phosphate acyltransferase PlsY
MGSIVAAAVFPLAVWLIAVPTLPVEVASLIGAAFIIYKHSSNIRRLRDGTENRFTFGARKP